MGTISVIIATRNRPELLRQTLRTLGEQTRMAEEIWVVDGSDGTESEQICAELLGSGCSGLHYHRSNLRSAAKQRNEGVDLSSGDYLVFMDDDVELEKGFLEHLVAPLEEDQENHVGGVSGTIKNQVYTQPSHLNRLLLSLILWDFSGSWAGKVVGPAVNFLPTDEGEHLKEVEWLFAGGTVYRRSAFSSERFGESFSGYSFAEDLHLSLRVGRRFRLLNTRKARFYHHDQGQHTHRDWRSLGKSMVENRRLIQTEILGMSGWVANSQLFLYEVVYGALSNFLSSRGSSERRRAMIEMLKGKLEAFGLNFGGDRAHREAR